MVEESTDVSKEENPVHRRSVEGENNLFDTHLILSTLLAVILVAAFFTTEAVIFLTSELIRPLRED